MLTMLSDIDMDEIITGLYIGSESATSDVEKLRNVNITHILTVNYQPLPEEITRHFKYKFVEALDIACTDLLSHFAECFSFIDDGIQTGGVLVHCFVGCSRSAMIVIGYLMYKQKKGFKEVLETVKLRRPVVSPNEGFRSQLLLFEKNGSNFSENHEWYRKYKLGRIAEEMKKGKSVRPDWSAVTDDFLKENPSSTSMADDVVYKCKKCRQPLFWRSGVMSHVVGAGEVAFNWKEKRANQTKNEATNHTTVYEEYSQQRGEICDQSLFIDPVKWMQDSIQVPEGKLSCPNCSVKLGSFVWYGKRCTCGAWVIPAFHVQISKVDECKPLLLPSLTKKKDDLT